MGARLVRRGQRWYAWIPRPGGGTRLVTTQCTDRRAAETRAGELERDALDPARQAAHKTSTVAAAELFVASRKRAGKAQGTLDHYRVKLGHAVRLLPRMLRDVTSDALERYIDERTQEGAARTTVKKELRAIGAMLRHAKRKGLFLPELERVLPEYADDYEPRKTRLAPDELMRLLWAVAAENNAQPSPEARNRAAMVGFIVGTGARLGEAVRAEAGDIDLAGGHVHIRGTKTAKALRDVPITPLSRPILEGIVSALEGRTGRLFDRWANVVRDLAVGCRQANVPRVTPNDLRRTFGGWLRAAGIAPDLIGDAMGHVDSRMVLRVYGRLQPGELGRLLNRGLTVGQVSSDREETDMNCEPLRNETALIPPQNVVPRDGIEPPTRGFSILRKAQGFPSNLGERRTTCRPNVRAFRALAWLHLARGAA
jgi:integrase